MLKEPVEVAAPKWEAGIVDGPKCISRIADGVERVWMILLLVVSVLTPFIRARVAPRWSCSGAAEHTLARRPRTEESRSHSGVG